MMNRSASWWWLHPGAAWLMLLATVFIAEYAVMLVLPWTLPAKRIPLLEATVDAFALTTFLAPILWWTVVCPLQEVIRLRTRYLTDLFSRTEYNKKRVAHELHDGIGQSLSLLVSGLRSAQEYMQDVEDAARCARLLGLAQNALKDVKRLALGLRPSILDDLGLAPALERLVSDLREQYAVAFRLDVADLAGVRLSEAAEIVVFRVVQEALANVVAHASASSAAVYVRRRNGSVEIEVTDDGCGFAAPEQKVGVAGHLGLLGMRERAALLGGTFAIESSPGRGTRIVVTIPEGV
jgi:signal transduction histidine kinase